MMSFEVSVALNFWGVSSIKNSRCGGKCNIASDNGVGDDDEARSLNI